MSESMAAAFIDQMTVAELFRREAWLQLAIARADDDQLVGDIGLFVAKHGEYGEVGFTVSPAAQGRRYASAAVAAALQLFFEHTAVPRVIGITDARNAASIKVLERVGMSRVDCRETVFKGEPCTEWVYACQR